MSAEKSQKLELNPVLHCGVTWDGCVGYIFVGAVDTDTMI